jgi:hypothetical protein
LNLGAADPGMVALKAELFGYFGYAVGGVQAFGVT